MLETSFLQSGHSVKATLTPPRGLLDAVRLAHFNDALETF